GGELEGMALEVERACLEAGASEVRHARSRQQSEEIWRIRRCLSQASYALGPVKVNEDITVPRSRIASAVKGTHEIARRHGISALCFGHIGDGNIHVNFMIGRSEDDRRRAQQAVSELFDLTLSLGGTLSGEHGVGITKLPYLERELSPDVLRFMSDIKAIFDPNGILNPHKAILRFAPRPHCGTF
ncbi:MAG: glycolate oxidase subunit GlcD, partial [Deltaproteobacteria bacterium]